MDPREYLLRYFTDLDKIDIPIDVKDTSVGGRLSRFGSRVGTPLKSFINKNVSIPNLLNKSSGVNTLGGEVVDVASSAPKSLLSQVKGRLPKGVTRFAGKLGPLKNVAGPYLNPVIATGMGIHRWGEGETPLDAFGRPIFQVGGGILGAGTGFLADSPFSPVADIALGYAGWEGGGKVYDALRGLTNEDERVIKVPVEPTVGNLDNLPNDYQTLPTHIGENRGPEHLITGVGPKHLQPEIEQDNLSEAVDQFLTDRKQWEQKTQNSPARRSGAFTDDELWALQQKHRDWKASRGR